MEAARGSWVTASEVAAISRSGIGSRIHGAIETDRWRNRWGWGGAFALGVGPDYLGPAYGYGYDAYDVPDAYAVAGAEGGHVQYCLSRYRSYDPATDSFIGYDGFRHPCVGPY